MLTTVEILSSETDFLGGSVVNLIVVSCYDNSGKMTIISTTVEPIQIAWLISSLISTVLSLSQSLSTDLKKGSTANIQETFSIEKILGYFFTSRDMLFIFPDAKMMKQHNLFATKAYHL